MAGMFEHVDLACYNLNAHAIKNHKRKMFKKQDMSDIRMRVETMWPPSDQVPALKAVDKLPMDAMKLMKDYPLGAWKVEWICNGSYDFQMNEMYRTKYFKFSRQQERGIYAKLWDTIGFSKFEISHKMWLETLFRPGKVIKYEGNAYLMDTKTVIFQVARMISHVYSFDNIVTVTVVTQS